MPLHVYAPLAPPCRLCGAGFEHRSAADAPPLAECPTCGQPVARAAIQSVSSPQLSTPASVSRAKSAGFTVLKRVGAGEFERQ